MKPSSAMRGLAGVVAGVLVLLQAAEPVLAQRSGRSYSGGGSRSVGRSPSMSGSRPSSPGRSYSPGGGTKAAPSPSRPSSPGVGSGTKSPPGSSTPSASGSGGKTYTSGSETKSSPGSRPAGGGFDSAASRAQKQQESKQAFQQGSQPRSTYTDGKGQTKTIDPKDQRIDSLRRDLNQERWTNRELRQRQMFEPYYGRPMVYYNDPFSNFFWFWMLSQSLNTRANWAYHHRSEMDEARYKELLAKDKELEAKVKELEAKNVQRDPNYTPPGVDQDLMYTDEFVDAAYNPKPPANSPPPAAVAARPSGSGFLYKAVTALGVLALLGGVAWLVFFKRWNVT